MAEEFKSVSVQQAKDLLKKGSVTVVDIRDSESYREAHIQGAISLNRDTIKEFMENNDKSKTVLCYCYRGFSSQDAARFLIKNGFEDVYNLQGGYEAWHSQGQ